MRKLVLILFVIILSTSIYGQKSSSVDLRSIINEQIEHAKIKKVKTEKVPVKPIIKLKKISKANNNGSFVNSDILFRIFILIEASFIAAMVVIVRRRLLERKTVGEKSLKANIKMLREEKLSITTDKSLSARRKKISKYLSGELSKVNITDLAKKLSVAKGEIHLAAKMKLLTQK